MIPEGPVFTLAHDQIPEPTAPPQIEVGSQVVFDNQISTITGVTPNANGVEVAVAQPDVNTIEALAAEVRRLCDPDVMLAALVQHGRLTVESVQESDGRHTIVTDVYRGSVVREQISR